MGRRHRGTAAVYAVILASGSAAAVLTMITEARLTGPQALTLTGHDRLISRLRSVFDLGDASQQLGLVPARGSRAQRITAALQQRVDALQARLTGSWCLGVPGSDGARDSGHRTIAPLNRA